MDYTTIQQFILKLLKTYRCLRDDQLDRLVCVSMPDYPPELAARQRERMLALSGHLVYRPLDGYTAMTAAVPDVDLIAATDVMLLYQKRGLAEHRPGASPFKLTFIKNGKDGFLRAYYVAVVHRGAEFLISQQIQGAYKGRKNAVLFLLDDIEQSDAIEFPHEHYYVVRKKSGFRFYEGGMTDYN